MFAARESAVSVVSGQVFLLPKAEGYILLVYRGFVECYVNLIYNEK